MDRNSAIGLTLIAALLLGYFYWFSPKPDPVDQQPEISGPVTSQPVEPDSASATTPAVVPDSVLALEYGVFSPLMKGTESLTRLETQDIIISFSNKGGIIRELERKNYRTYYQEPLMLILPQTTSFQLQASYNGKDIDRYDLSYEVDQQKLSESTVLTFTARLTDGSELSQRYTIPDKGYEIKYDLVSDNFAGKLNGEQLSFVWDQTILPTEKDLADTRSKTTINYFSDEDGFDNLPEQSSDLEKEVLSYPQKWIAIKQKYFLSSLIAGKTFSGAELSIITNPEDTSIVKTAVAKLAIPKGDLAAGTVSFKYYLGPNDYQLI